MTPQHENYISSWVSKEGYYKERNVLFKDTSNTFDFLVYGMRYIVKRIAREETHCHYFTSYYFWLTTSDLYLHLLTYKY